MTNQELKQYVKAIYEMESSIFMLDKLWKDLNQMNNVLSAYNGDRVYELEEKLNFFDFYDLNFCDEGISYGIATPFGFAILGAIVGLILSFIILKSFNLIFFLVFVGIGFCIPFLICTIQCVSDSIKTNENNKNITKQNTIIEEKSRRKIAECEKHSAIIGEQMDKIADIYNRTTELLDKYYAMDVIYPKYRNFVAISSFYEYLLTGRCNTLEGHGGIYDTFEYESRLDRIVTKLDDILESLEDIKSNQFQLYTAINSGFNQSNAMYTSILSSLDNINDNQNISNFYSQQTAMNSEFLRMEKIFSSI